MQAESYPCNWSQSAALPGRGHTAQVIPSSATYLTVAIPWRSRVVDAAGNVSTLSREVSRRQHSRPILSRPQVTGGEAWRRTNDFTVSWTNPPDHAAPIVRAHWKLCASDGSCPARGHRDGGRRSRACRASRAQRRGLPAPRLARRRRRERTRGERRDFSRRSASIQSLRNWLSSRSDPVRPVAGRRQCCRPSLGRCQWARSRCVPAARPPGTDSRTNREGSLLVAHVDDERFRNGAVRVPRPGRRPSGKRSVNRSAERRIRSNAPTARPHRHASCRRRTAHGRTPEEHSAVAAQAEDSSGVLTAG